jgi:glycosyltransferase involved in cell wall biosynthesis
LDHVNKDFRKFILRKRDFSLQKANSVVTISPWHVEQLKKNSSNVNLIYNGYCPEYFFPRKSKPQNTFKVTYTGLIVSTAYRDPTLLFLAVKKLAENGHIDNRFRIQFYTPKNRRMPLLENPSFEAIKNYVDFFEYVDTSEVPELLADSSILLLLTNKFKDDGPKGIMTTKYFEYLAMERPILCVRSDENLLEMSIKEANAGVAARTIEETYDFLLEKWNEWIEKGRTSVEPNREYTRQFSRKLQAKEFVDIFRKVIDS